MRRSARVASLGCPGQARRSTTLRGGVKLVGGLADGLDPAPAGLLAPSTEAPHFGQNAKPGSQRYPQEPQCLGCFVPQAGQKAKAGSSSAPQPAHFIVQNPKASAETRSSNHTFRSLGQTLRRDASAAWSPLYRYGLPRSLVHVLNLALMMFIALCSAPIRQRDSLSSRRVTRVVVTRRLALHPSRPAMLVALACHAKKIRAQHARRNMEGRRGARVPLGVECSSEGWNPLLDTAGCSGR